MIRAYGALYPHTCAEDPLAHFYFATSSIRRLASLTPYFQIAAMLNGQDTATSERSTMPERMAAAFLFFKGT